MMVGYADETVVGAETVGGRLRSAREAHGLSLDDIAARTRVPTRHLKAIEEDAFDQLPAAPYSVGFAKAFADAVGLNREEIGREFRAEKEGYGATDAGYSYSSDEPSPSGSGGIVRLALILVIIAALAFGLWKSGLLGGSAPVVAPPAAPPAPAAEQVVPPAVPETQAPPSATDDNGNQATEETSRGTQGNEQSEDSTRSGRRDRESGAEPRSTGSSAGNSAEPATPETSASPPPKTTRELNMERMQPAAPPAAAPSTPAPAAPPVIAPPAPASPPDATP